jgi:hypothetical protein
MGAHVATLTYHKAGGVKVADELYLIVALLHRENPSQDAFSVAEIAARAAFEGLGGAREDQRSLKQHAYEHAAANVAPGKRGGRYRMVFRQEDNRIRLLWPSDYVHPERHQKFHPEPSEVPERYHELLAWAKSRQEPAGIDAKGWLSGLLGLRGLGKQVWAGVDPDEYVRSLREGWQ